MSRQAHDSLPLKPAPVRHRSNGAKQLSSFAPLSRRGEGESTHLVPLCRQAVAHRKRRMERNDQQPRQVSSLQLRVTIEFDSRCQALTQEFRRSGRAQNQLEFLPGIRVGDNIQGTELPNFYALYTSFHPG